MRERFPMTDAASSTIPGVLRKGDRGRRKASQSLRYSLDILMIISYLIRREKAYERATR